jgi:hypothetical protein
LYADRSGLTRTLRSIVSTGSQRRAVAVGQCKSPESQPRDLLRRYFYHDCFVPEFPDPNERESFEVLQSYLRLKETGWYRKNNYHIIVLLDGDKPIGGSIADYLDEPNAGVIEQTSADALLGPVERADRQHGHGRGNHRAADVPGRALDGRARCSISRPPLEDYRTVSRIERDRLDGVRPANARAAAPHHPTATRTMLGRSGGAAGRDHCILDRFSRRDDGGSDAL